jgi:hypothetical protein
LNYTTQFGRADATSTEREKDMYTTEFHIRFNKDGEVKTYYKQAFFAYVQQHVNLIIATRLRGSTTVESGFDFQNRHRF